MIRFRTDVYVDAIFEEKKNSTDKWVVGWFHSDTNLVVTYTGEGIEDLPAWLTMA